jgi:hypothetical protein
MAFTTDSAVGHIALLTALKDFAVANGWDALDPIAGQTFLKAKGNSGLDEIYMGISCTSDAGNSRYNWDMLGSWGYAGPTRPFTGHPRSSNDGTDTAKRVVSHLTNVAMPYWLVCNPRRIILVAKVGTTYQHVYIGLLTPPATDAQYPYPLFIGGGGNSLGMNSGDDPRAYWSNAYWTARLSWPGGSWGSSGYPSTYENPQHKVATANETNKTVMLTGLDGSYLLEPLYVQSYSAGGILGLLDGVYRVTGYGNFSENIITVGGTNYMVFQDGSRSGYGDYCALRLS